MEIMSINKLMQESSKYKNKVGLTADLNTSAKVLSHLDRRTDFHQCKFYDVIYISSLDGISITSVN